MNLTSPNSKFWSILFVLLVYSSNCSAAELNGEAFRILANDVRGSIDGGFVASGNVELTYGSMSFQADRASFEVEENAFKGIKATGAPVRLKLTIDDGEDQRTIQAEGSSVIYRVAEDQIEFSGNARVESEEISITGNKIWLDVDKYEIEAESLDSDNQVEVIFRNIDVDEKPAEE